MRCVRTEWKGALVFSLICVVLALVACSSDPEDGGPVGIPQGGDTSPDLVITNGRVIDDRPRPRKSHRRCK